MNWHGNGSQAARRSLAVCLAALVGLFLADSDAHAHKVNVFAYVEGDRVIVEGYFSASVKAQDCLVEVFDEGGKKIHEGKTDRKGIYSFNLPDLAPFSGSLRIVLEGGMGHKSEYTLSATDIPNSSQNEAPPKQQASQTQSEDASVMSVAGSARNVDQAALTKVLETMMDKKLEPLIRMLGMQERLLMEQKQAGPRMTDIVGGIGWIMGLVGITSFFLGRSRSAKKSPE